MALHLDSIIIPALNMSVRLFLAEIMWNVFSKTFWSVHTFNTPETIVIMLKLAENSVDFALKPLICSFKP